jgi:hypothetical protein
VHDGTVRRCANTATVGPLIAAHVLDLDQSFLAKSHFGPASGAANAFHPIGRNQFDGGAAERIAFRYQALDFWKELTA